MVVTQHFSGCGFRVASVERDNVGWDLVATRENLFLLLEVKGLSGHAVCVELTPNEYGQMRAHRGDYRLCVVTDALGQTPTLHCFVYEKHLGVWRTQEGKELEIRGMVSARMTAEDPESES